MALSTNIALTLVATLTGTADLSTPKDTLNYPITDTLDSGTAIDQADKIYRSTRTLGSGANESLDLAGSLTDALGATITFAKVKLILIKNKSTTAANILTVGAAASNAFESWGATGSTIKVGPDGFVVLYNPSAAGYAVTAGTGDLLKIANGGSSSTAYDIIIVGTSA
jgi:hypothetical protein